jgi:DNA-binding transcriptional MerR regulator
MQTHDPVRADGTSAPALFSIGQLARRCGVSVRTIRFWSDEGLVPPVERSPSGYRRYDAVAVARLDLVRALRELGMGHDEVREVLARRRGVDEVAAAHVQAIDARVRGLRVQRAVCALLARGEHNERSTVLMNDLARLSAQQRQQMLDEFVTETFAGTDPDAPGAWIADCMRAMPTELPDDPSTEQVQAWVELAELVGDPGFRARCREMAVAGSRADDEPAGYDPTQVYEHVAAALQAGIPPDSAAAVAVLDRIPGLAGLDIARRRALADRTDTFCDRRVERYWALLGTLNDWPK